MRHAFTPLLRFVSLLSLWVLPSLAAAQVDTIKVGQSIALSGSHSPNASLYYQGIKLHLDAINAAGGIDGRPVELITLDDEGDPAKCKENTRRLLDQDRVVALVGYAGEATIEACAPLASAAKVPLIAPMSGSPLLRSPSDRYVFFLRASIAAEIKAHLNYLALTGVDQIGLAYQDNALGQTIKEEVETQLRANNMKPPALGIIPASRDAQLAARSIAETAPTSILLATTGEASVAFVEAYKKTRKPVQFMGLSTVSGVLMARELGEEADATVISQVVPSPWNRKLPLARDFLREADANPNVQVSYIAFEGYIAARVLVEAIRRSSFVTSENLVLALESMGDYNLNGFSLHFGPNTRTASDYVGISLMRSDGRFIE